MTESQKEFCKDVAKLCEAANAPHLYSPIINIWALYEDATTAADDPTKVVDNDLNSMTSTQAQENAAEFTKLAEQKKAAEEAKQKSTEDAAILAEKMNEQARLNEQDQQANPDTVNG